MEYHEPWLADFIVSGLTEYIRKLRTGQPLVQYRSKSNGGETIQLWRGAHFEGTVRVVQIIQEHPLKGVLSDGRHHIETVFGKSVEAQLKASGVQISELTSPFFALRVTKPTIIVDGAYGKPKLRLLTVDCQEERTVKVQGTMPLAEGSLAGEDRVIKEKVLELLQLNPGERRVASMPSDSPQSVKSQVAYDNDNPSDSEDDVYQERFQTQIPQSSSYHPAPKPALANARIAATETYDNSELLAQLQRRGQRKKPSETAAIRKSPSKPAQSSHENSEPYSQAANIDIAPTVPGSFSPSMNEQNAAEVSSAQPLRHDEQMDKRESGANGPSAVNDGDESTEAIPTPKPGVLQPSLSAIAPELPTGLVCHFARWRREARSGKYVPRYVQKIPEDQKTLLESDDSWQPPLVGHASRPGQVPLPLLERLCQAADQKALSLEEAQDVPERRTTEHEAQPVASWKELSPSPGNAESDSEISQASWSASPPTQERRVRKLPADSPPLAPRQAKRPLSSQENAFDRREDTTQQQSALSNSLDTSPLDTAAQKDSHEGRCRELVSPVEGTHETSITQSSKEAPKLSADTLKSSEHMNAVANRVQVERTPHVPKGNWYHASSDLMGIIDDADLPLSCIPATHYENTNKHIDQSRAAKTLHPSLSREKEQKRTRITDRMPANGAEAANQPLDTQTAQLHGARPAVASTAPVGTDTVGIGGPEEESHEATQAVSETRLPARSHGSQNALLVPIQYGFVPDDYAAPEGQSPAEASPPRSYHPQPALPLSSKPDLGAVEEAATDRQARAETGPVVEEIVASFESGDARGRSPILAGKRRHPEDAFGPRKRPRRAQPLVSERSFDPAYASVYKSIEERRRAQLSRIAKPKSLSGQSASSSVKGFDNAGDALRESSSPPMHLRTPVTADISPRESTPITRVSIYAGIDGHNSKVRPSDSISQTLAPLHIDLPPVFAQFKAAYADYNGDLDDFGKSYRLLGNLLRRGQAPHQFLFDDAICHHFNSYRRYLAEEGANDPDRPMAFHEYYARRVPTPTHLKSIVTLKMFQGISSRPHSVASRRSSGRADNTSIADIPSLLSRQEMSVEERSVTNHEANHEKADDEKNLSQSDQAVEQWRREVSCPASPELGTRDVDRSRSDISMIDCEVPDQNMSKFAPGPSDPEPSKKRRNVSVQASSTAMTPPMAKPSKAPQFKKPSRTSTSGRPVLSSSSARSAVAQSPAVKKFTKWCNKLKGL
ncbi:hypothetical protein EDD36DRAFT_230913 [Exophiala viscosa]|uniref:Telomere replication protein EST3 n=1 Tax=Exophiala viscosa TaxID=2486360 RepID=A0AAN6DZS5_9EURO|nr:hypothetical protein EDD36DRAFT_230913 [Exophiala viscosa]